VNKNLLGKILRWETFISTSHLLTCETQPLGQIQSVSQRNKEEWWLKQSSCPGSQTGPVCKWWRQVFSPDWLIFKVDWRSLVWSVYLGIWNRKWLNKRPEVQFEVLPRTQYMCNPKSANGYIWMTPYWIWDPSWRFSFLKSSHFPLWIKTCQPGL
jgi:hypothetical protein